MIAIRKVILGVVFAGTFNAVCANPAADEEQRAAVRDLMEVMNTRQSMSAMAANMRNQLPQMLDQQLTRMSKDRKWPAEKVDQMKAATTALQTESFEKLRELYASAELGTALDDIMARTYAKHFSTEEIRAVTAFYRTPAGQKVLKTLPRVMQDAIPELMQIINPKIQSILSSTMDEARKRYEVIAGQNASN